MDARKTAIQQLIATLKQYYPQALQIAGELQEPQALELLRRWPTLKQLQRAHRDALRRFFRQYGRRNDAEYWAWFLCRVFISFS